MFEWTEEQLKVLACRPKPGERVFVQAVAGAGKTSTAAELMRRMASEEPEKKHLMVSFARADREAASRKLADVSNVDVRTFDSIVFTSIQESCGATTLYAEPDWKIAQSLMEDWEKTANVGPDAALVGPWRMGRNRPRGRGGPPKRETYRLQQDLAQGVLPMLTAIFSACDEDELRTPCPAKWIASALAHAGQNDAANLVRNHPNVMMALARNVHSKLKFQGRFIPEFARSLLAKDPKPLGYSKIIVDEGQDTNLNMQKLIVAQTRSGIVFVGDPKQHIYSFNYCANIFDTLQADECLHLSTSWRFGQNIADFARRFLEPGDRLEGGRLVEDAVFLRTSLLGAFERARLQARRNGGKWPKMAVLCRKNKGVAAVLVALRGLMCRKPNPFETQSELWKEMDIRVGVVGTAPTHPILKRELNHLRDKGQKTYSKSLRETTSGWEKHMCSKHGIGTTETTLKWLLEASQDADQAQIIVSTVHKFKGQERDWVVVWEDVKVMDVVEKNSIELSEEEGDDEEDHADNVNNSPAEIVTKDQEVRNLAYTATTRARDMLFVC